MFLCHTLWRGVASCGLLGGWVKPLTKASGNRALSFNLLLLQNLSMKKQRTDSTAAKVSAMLNASLKTIEPPCHVVLRAGDRVFWHGVVRARARDEWTETDLVVAGQLARCLHDIQVEQVLLDEEGTVLRNDKGTQIVNPRVSVLEQFARREMALMRTLRMGGRVAGAARDEERTRKLERSSRQLRDELVEDDLLA